MRVLLTAIIFLTQILLTACQKTGGEAKQPEEQIETRLQIATDDGKVVDKLFPSGSQIELNQISELFEGVSGKFVISVNVIRSNDSFVQENEGTLKDGRINGMLYTFMSQDGKRQLISKESYKNDIREGQVEVYNPKNGNIQLVGNYVNNLKNGIFDIFYSGNQLAARISYIDDEYDGIFETFDRDGEPVTSGIYSAGICVSGSYIEDIGGFISRSTTTLPIHIRVFEWNINGKEIHESEIVIN